MLYTQGLAGMQVVGEVMQCLECFDEWTVTWSRRCNLPFAHLRSHRADGKRWCILAQSALDDECTYDPLTEIQQQRVTQ